MSEDLAMMWRKNSLFNRTAEPRSGSGSQQLRDKRTERHKRRMYNQDKIQTTRKSRQRLMPYNSNITTTEE